MKGKAGMAWLVAALIAIGSVGAYFAWTKHQQTSLVEALTPHVKNASLHVSNCVRYEQDTGGITYGEYFDRLDDAISEIDKRIVDVRTISSSRTASTTDPTVEYLAAGQELLRSVKRYNHVHGEMAAFSKYVAEWKTQVEQGNRLAYGEKDELLKRGYEIEKQRRDAGAGLSAAVERVARARDAVADTYTADALVPTDQLETLLKIVSTEST